MGPVSFLGAEAKNCPETSVPNCEAWRYRRAAVSGVWVIPGISFTIGINTHFKIGLAFRDASVSGAEPGDTAWRGRSHGTPLLEPPQIPAEIMVEAPGIEPIRAWSPNSL